MIPRTPGTRAAFRLALCLLFWLASPGLAWASLTGLSGLDTSRLPGLPYKLQTTALEQREPECVAFCAPVPRLELEASTLAGRVPDSWHPFGPGPRDGGQNQALFATEWGSGIVNYANDNPTRFVDPTGHAADASTGDNPDVREQMERFAAAESARRLLAQRPTTHVSGQFRRTVPTGVDPRTGLSTSAYDYNFRDEVTVKDSLSREQERMAMALYGDATFRAHGKQVVKTWVVGATSAVGGVATAAVTKGLSPALSAVLTDAAAGGTGGFTTGTVNGASAEETLELTAGGALLGVAGGQLFRSGRVGDTGSFQIPEPERLVPAAPAAAPGTAPITDPGRLLTAGSMDDAIAANYRRYYTEAGRDVVRGFNLGKIEVPVGTNWRQVLGGRIDSIARARLRNFLSREGIAEGPAADVAVNRWLRDPSGSGAYRIPDVMLKNSRRILDGTIGSKTPATPQIQDFGTFSGGYDVEIVRPDLAPFRR